MQTQMHAWPSFVGKIPGKATVGDVELHAGPVALVVGVVGGPG
jgi:hypothetical protein